MSSVDLVDVGVAYDAPVLTAVQLRFGPGWTGVVGPNGGGKSTLLGAIAGLVPLERGHVRLPGVVHLCPQRVEALDDAIEALAWDWSRDGVRWRARLGLDPEDLARWPTLSPGERKRWQIGAALCREPDVLLLDEPGNHLDHEGRERLIEALRAWRGIGVVVAHDRALLDGLTEATVLVRRGTATRYAGAYTAARAQWTLEDEQALAALEAAQDARRGAARRLADLRRTQGAVVRQRSTGARMKSPKDSDARGLLADYRVARAESAVGRGVELARRALERAETDEAALGVDQTATGAVHVGYVAAPKAVLAHIEGRLGYERTVLSGLDLTLRRDDRVHVAGANGSGKTTLLRALVDALPADEVLYLPQEIELAEACADLEAVRALPPEVRGRVLQLVALLGVDPARLLDTSAPSPGEARKLRIALGLGRRVWALVLDEPTNHLDLPSIERLEEALASWPGALVLVTHDEAFAASCTERVWRVGSGRLEVEHRKGHEVGPRA